MTSNFISIRNSHLVVRLLNVKLTSSMFVLFDHNLGPELPLHDAQPIFLRLFRTTLRLRVCQASQSHKTLPEPWSRCIIRSHPSSTAKRITSRLSLSSTSYALTCSNPLHRHSEATPATGEFLCNKYVIKIYVVRYRCFHWLIPHGCPCDWKKRFSDVLAATGLLAAMFCTPEPRWETDDRHRGPSLLPSSADLFHRI